MGQDRKLGVVPAMTRDEYLAAIATLGYSQEGFARLVGSSPRTGQKWALGETRIPGSVALLLRLLLLLPNPRALADQLGGAETRKRDVKAATPASAANPARASVKPAKKAKQ